MFFTVDIASRLQGICCGVRLYNKINRFININRHLLYVYRASFVHAMSVCIVDFSICDKNGSAFVRLEVFFL